MKKILYSAMILSLAFATSCEKKDDNKPKTWDTSLGKASFATDNTWKIPAANGAPAQEWSDAVQTDSCSSKTVFSGYNSATGSYNVDCRSNPGQKGDLFSWRAVKVVVGICPQGWRVPDTADFRNLDIALGFNSENRYQQTINGHSWQAQLDAYFTTWGGAYGGFCHPNGSLSGQGFNGIYWSQSEHNAGNGLGMDFTTAGYVNPQSWINKNKGYGFSLRCVR
ncbi:MAG: fibrobacter succinogenes major paralogous domain-containing protein [Bacteroidales bacterium]|nr:fibrobacter succinogenes major paralogous domain-containing protein [Bacteroidales bacterium]